jgi:hypothetical protein
MTRGYWLSASTSSCLHSAVSHHAKGRAYDSHVSTAISATSVIRAKLPILRAEVERICSLNLAYCVLFRNSPQAKRSTVCSLVLPITSVYFDSTYPLLWLPITASVANAGLRKVMTPVLGACTRWIQPPRLVGFLGVDPASGALGGALRLATFGAQLAEVI